MQIHEFMKDNYSGETTEYPTPSSSDLSEITTLNSQNACESEPPFSSSIFIPEPNYIRRIHEPIREPKPLDQFIKKVFKISFIARFHFLGNIQNPFFSKISSIFLFFYRNIYPFNIPYLSQLKKAHQQDENIKDIIFAALDCNLNLFGQYTSTKNDVNFIMNPYNKDYGDAKKKEACDSILKCYFIQHHCIIKQYYRKLEKIGN